MIVPDVNAQMFFDAILDAGGDHIMKPKDNQTVIHIIVGPLDALSKTRAWLPVA